MSRVEKSIFFNKFILHIFKNVSVKFQVNILKIDKVTEIFIVGSA